MNPKVAIQDQIPDNHCYGCGPSNTDGLRLKSFWGDDNIVRASFVPAAYHCAGPLGYVNGGVLATIVDCHCVCTALAKAYQMAGRELGTGDKIWFATGKLEISYLAPALIDQPLEIQAQVREAKEKKIIVDCQVYSAGTKCCNSEVIAVRVPGDW
jgi:acyl-CoA thioesterase FadM